MNCKSAELDKVWIIDSSAIRLLDPTTNNVTTVVGSLTEGGNVDGIGTSARSDGIRAFTVTSTHVFFSTVSRLLRSVDKTNFTTVTFGGVRNVIDVPASPNATLYREVDQLFVMQGNLYALDYVLKKVDLATGSWTAISSCAGGLGRSITVLTNDSMALHTIDSARLFTFQLVG